ncbi:signal peptidase II [Occallatibacter riparius]|uniref:Lipoprotein signal peptidase n=1 Tax=Occallatibacter riparius TaxID=1002689 RepID=A0A9J7BJ14_9BACT|nr:signal peptidase II [Occallatibacter riparius]UWZ82473.1 signal peptidase II [Occallatibacter riparius]
MSLTSAIRLPWLLLISLAVFTADRWTKTWVEAHIALGSAIPVIDHIFRLSHWTNEGAAFSMFAESASPHLVRWGLIGFTIIASIAVLIAMVRLGHRFTLTTIALALIFGGALGNVHDRIEYGSVVDFLEVHIFSYHWPDFNVADSAVVIGACLLVLDSIWGHRPAAEPADGTQ